MSLGRSVAFCICLVCSIETAVADAGWVVDTRFAGGTLYSERENRSVAMSEEVILSVFGAGATHFTIHFLFENQTTREETVEVGFPVVADIDYASPAVGRELVYLVMDPRVAKANEGKRLWDVAPDRVLRREIGWERFRSEMETIAEEGSAARMLLGFTVMQDGGPLAVERVVLEGQSTGEMSDRVTAHMLFRLRFPARQVSLVTVDYRMFALEFAGQVGSVYRTRYVLGTGRTWAGSIGKLYVLTNGTIEDPPDALRVYDSGSGAQLITASGHEPEADERIEILYRDLESPRSTLAGLGAASVAGTAGQRSAYPAVTVKGASSAYPGQTKVVALDAGGVARWWNTTYGPAALFDGIVTNAWVENARDSGVGEYVEFVLEQPALGLEVYNGLKMLPNGDESEGYADPAATALAAKNIWERNNRVYELTLARTGGGTVTLKLNDDWGPQRMPGLFLPGTYRAIIRSVHLGTEWDDTCLGEITFWTVPNTDLMREASPRLWEALWAGAP